MKIETSNIESAIQKINTKTTKCVLIYGQDGGLVTIRKTNLLNKLLPNYKNDPSLVTINKNILKENPDVINIEYNSNSFFGDKKVILIEFDDVLSKTEDDKIAKILKDIFSFAQENSNNFIIISSLNDLEKDSSLRHFAELNKYVLSIRCYQDDEDTIIRLMKDRLNAEKFSYTGNVIKYLSQNFGGDRLIVLNELEKLIIYKGNDKNLTIEDVQANIKDNSEENITTFIDYFATLNSEEAFKEIKKIYLSKLNVALVMRMLINHFIKLQLCKYKMNMGISLEEIVTKHEPFFKRRKIFKEQLEKLNLKDINFILLLLFKEEARLRGSKDISFLDN